MLQTGENIAVAHTESGRVRGYIHNGIYTFKGIPYAEAKRFELPQKPTPWDGIRSSMTYGPVAPLISPTSFTWDESEFVFNHNWGYTSEDCLRINIWTPETDDKKRPVLFWIHGGGFVAGSSQELPSYDGENLAKKGDVIVVSINHRLNILGFLDLSAYGEKYKHSANLSIIDIEFALQWVQANIQNFGGDPQNVTIFGQSGGGAKVNMLMAMPSAKGLFHKAINQSGSYPYEMLEKKETQAIAAEILKYFRLDPDEAEMLQNVPLDKLNLVGKKALDRIQFRRMVSGKKISEVSLGWGPSIDGEVIPNEIFSPESLALSKNIPLLLGTVKNEFGSMFNGMSDWSLAEIKKYIKKRFGSKAGAYIAAIKKVYPNDKKPTDLIDVDTTFRPVAVNEANIKSNYKGSAPVYIYLFEWQSPVLNGKYKAMHCMELPFVFNNISRCQEMTGGTEEAYALAEKVSQCWINFARFGDPNHEGIPKWPTYNSKETATMHFDYQCAVKPQMDKELFELVKREQ